MAAATHTHTRNTTHIFMLGLATICFVRSPPIIAGMPARYLLSQSVSAYFLTPQNAVSRGLAAFARTSSFSVVTRFPFVS